MSPTNRRSFIARSAALAAVPTVAVLAGSTLAGQASAATLPDHAPVLPSGLPLTDRHLTEREKANLAVVLQAYHDGEGDSLAPRGSGNCSQPTVYSTASAMWSLSRAFRVRN
jgi:hypothetical protein